MARCLVFHKIHSNILHRKRKLFFLKSSRSTSDEEVFNCIHKESTQYSDTGEGKVYSKYLFYKQIEIKWQCPSYHSYNLLQTRCCKFFSSGSRHIQSLGSAARVTLRVQVLHLTVNNATKMEDECYGHQGHSGSTASWLEGTNLNY